MPAYDPTTLLKQIAAGDETAFTIFYNMQWDKMCRYLHRITKSYETAEELTSDVFVKLWIGRELLQDIRNIDAFLYKVAYNKAISFLRAVAGKPVLQAIVEDNIFKPGYEAADHALMAEEQRRILNEAIRNLSPQRRAVLLLSREKELSNDEIAKMLNLSPNTVKNTLSDALRSLRQFLKSERAGSMLCLWWIG